jgi:hypothetical protein
MPFPLWAATLLIVGLSTVLWALLWLIVWVL